MKQYQKMSGEELLAEKERLTAAYREYAQMNLHLDMSRGKPSREQLNLSMGLLDVLDSASDLTAEDGTDCRNYGGLTGIYEAKKLLADMAGVSPEEVIVYGNSSLNIMYDQISRSMMHGVMGSTPWCKLDHVKFLCPSPGYDRHFAITESFGIEMIPVPMTKEGPDMDMVEQIVNNDEAVKGIWCVPKYSNPQGITYSEETVCRMAELTPAAEDFRIFWDNAYCEHHLYPDRQDKLANIFEACKRAGHPDLVYEFVSTSKITFPGSGIAAVAASPENLAEIECNLRVETLGYDKINELRHVRFFHDIDGLRAHMRKQADILRPHFEAVLQILHRDLDGTGIASFTEPAGGYFISFESLPGCAKDIVSRMKEAGVIMTSAGATYPYGFDPNDSNIRIAPTFPETEELMTATEIFTVCVRLSSVEKILKDRTSCG